MSTTPMNPPQNPSSSIPQPVKLSAAASKTMPGYVGGPLTTGQAILATSAGHSPPAKPSMRPAPTVEITMLCPAAQRCVSHRCPHPPPSCKSDGAIQPQTPPMNHPAETKMAPLLREPTRQGGRGAFHPFPTRLGGLFGTAGSRLQTRESIMPSDGQTVNRYPGKSVTRAIVERKAGSLSCGACLATKAHSPSGQMETTPRATTVNALSHPSFYERS
jgi:hypothetical protein